MYHGCILQKALELTDNNDYSRYKIIYHAALHGFEVYHLPPFFIHLARALVSVGMAAMCKASMECATKDIPVISEPK